jgi:hypothetical protein
MDGFTEREMQRAMRERLTDLLAETTALNIAQAAAINRQAEFIRELVSEQQAERIPPRPAGRAMLRVMRAAS